MICTFCLELSIYIRYDLWLSWNKSVGKLTEFDTLRNTGLWKSMVLEMIVGAVAPYPFLEDLKYTEYVKAYDVTINYEINDILLYVCFFRIYLPCRFAFYLTEFMNPRT